MQTHSPNDNALVVGGASRPNFPTMVVPVQTHAPAPAVQGAIPYTFLTYAQLEELPPSQWLVRKLLPKHSFGVVYGESGAGKSFVALDMALSVATGRSWAGLKVCTGPVRYIVAEGNVGFVARIKAWHKEKGVKPPDDAQFLLSPVPMAIKSEVQRLVLSLKQAENRPDLVVIDTFARCFVGGDENIAKDMGLFVDAVQQIQHATGATVLVVHHTGKRRSDGSLPPERGSSALRAAADTMIKVTLDKGGDNIWVDCDKQKDAEELSGLCFVSKVIEVGQDAEGEIVTSLALIHKEQSASMLAASGTGKAAAKVEKDAKMLSVLLTAPGRCVTNSNWGKASGLTDSSFRRHRDSLLKQGLIQKTADGDWMLTTAGVVAATPSPFTSRGGDPDLGPAAATPPLGGGGSGDGGYEHGIPDEYWEEEMSK